MVCHATERSAQTGPDQFFRSRSSPYRNHARRAGSERSRQNDEDGECNLWQRQARSSESTYWSCRTRDATGQSPLPNTAADRAGERWRDALRSIPSFPLTFRPTRIVIPLARYRKPDTVNMEASLPPDTLLRNSSRTGGGLRAWRVTADIAPNADGSVLIATGKTQVICAVTIENSVPRWMKDQRVPGGWITAEYSMLPYSTLTRRPRDVTKGKLDGRSVEIQRLIGRALRVAIDLDRLGERTLWVDCDVLQADGGTRTAAITGGSIAITLACAKLFENKILTEWPVRCLVGAVSAGVVDGQVLVDLDYEEDRRASVDLNLVMNSRREFIEIQGAGEEATFSGNELSEMLRVAESAIFEIINRQQAFLQSTVPNLPEF